MGLKARYGHHAQQGLCYPETLIQLRHSVDVCLDHSDEPLANLSHIRNIFTYNAIIEKLIRKCISIPCMSTLVQRLIWHREMQYYDAIVNYLECSQEEMAALMVPHPD